MTTPDKRTPTKAVFYFRTLKRWPGGNADMLTIKVTRRLSPGAAPELEAQFYSCFDGNHAWYPPRRAAIDPGDALASFLDVTRSLAARGSQALTVSLLDPSDDEWDCDWAESEVYLVATDDGPETPDKALLRLVRRTSKSKASAPDPELERAFELARRITGVGRVLQFANTQDALSAAYRAQGTEAKDLDYALVMTPTYLPPETDAAFVKAQAGATKKRAAARAAEASRRESMLVYRLDEAPGFLTRELPPDATPRKCLFYAARYDTRLTDALYEAVPEPSHDATDAALAIASRISQIASQSEDFARRLRPDQVPAGGSLIGGSYAIGFHGGDADAVERWLDAQGVTRVSLRTFLDQLILLHLVDEDGAPLEQVDKLAGGPPIRTVDSLDDDGLYVFERDRDHADFRLAPVTDEGLDDDDESWVELRASDLPPGAVHTVVVPTAPASTKAPAKKTAAKKTAAKKTAAKKTAAKKTTSRRPRP